MTGAFVKKDYFFLVGFVFFSGFFRNESPQFVEVEFWAVEFIPVEVELSHSLFPEVPGMVFVE
jgi:hypothetical protein